MAEHGECSSSLKPCDKKVWAKLVSSDSRYSDVEIRSNEMVICSEVTTSSPDKHEWCKITRNSDLCSATIQNQSLYSILVDKAVVQSKDDVVIRCGDEIIAGPDGEGYLRYKFEVMPTQEACNKKMKICIEVEHAKCSICLNIWHDVVTVAPCLHNFCNGCFSEWLRRCQLKHSAVLCPQCRAVVQYVGRNHFLHNIEEDILEADELLKRTDEELALLDSYASIRSSLVIRSGKRLPRKRVRLPADEDSPSDEQSYSTEFPCPQCDSEIRGFQCNWNTVHLQCQACGGMMPSRTGISVPQHCLGCDRAFCGAYWNAQSIGTSDSHLICGHDSFKPISERTITRIPSSAHERNLHEQDITAQCIGHMGRTLQDVISDWIAKLNNREIDRTRLPLNNAEMITAGTHFCSDCYDKLVSFLLYWFRISIPRYHLPPEASSREDCWYGYTCRTQHHSVEHARKRNHVCRPTRGSNM